MGKPLTKFAITLAAMGVIVSAWSPSADAARTREELQQIATKLVGELAQACPHKPGQSSERAAYQACVSHLLQSTTLPLAPVVLWGGDQPDLRIKDRKLTRFNDETFRRLYMPMMSFTGKFTLERDARDNLDVIRVEAYFRNAMPSGDYPYPFWHNDSTWGSFEAMNFMNFYLDDKGRVIVMTRSAGGSNADRGPYAHVTPPAFVKDQWTWTDSSGQQQPRITMFSARYQANNPALAKLDGKYRAFADAMREVSCVGCHNPKNPPGTARLVLLQTPLHAAAEIEHVIKSVQSNDMPVNDMGLPKDISPTQREAILATARAFRDELKAADNWEAANKPKPAGAAAPAKPTR